MGLLTKIFNDASDTEFKLAQDLVAIAIADDEVSEKERKEMERICRNEGISDETLNEFMMGFDSSGKCQIPQQRKERMDYLTKLIRVMCADGFSSNMEIYLLQIIASKLDINHMELISLVLMTASRKYFKGDTGTRALASFLRNVIDPRGKSLHDNRENIRTLFDLMAEHVPQEQNMEEDKAAFVKAMNKATELLIENTLLCNEFRAIGIDLETVLMDEREHAIRRWLE